MPAITRARSGTSMSASRAIAASNDSGSRLRSRASRTRVSTFPSPGPRDRLFRQRQHPGCDVSCQDRAVRSDTLSRQERLLAGASRDIEVSMADVNSGQVKHPLGQRC